MLRCGPGAAEFRWPEQRLAARRQRAGERAQLRENVVGRFDERRAVPDQLVAAARERIMDRAGNGEHLASLLGGEPRGDQRAGARRGLDDEHAERESADQAVATREVRAAAACRAEIR